MVRKKASKASIKHSSFKNNTQKTITEDSSSLSEQQWTYLSVACAISSLILYWNTVTNDFCFDDFVAVVNNPDVRGEAPLSNLFQNDFWATPLRETLSNKSHRPITTLSYRITALLHGVEPMPFHFSNILLNATASYMTVQCVKTMTASTCSSWIFPVVTCLLFTFHPIHTEVVATVVGRADLLAAIFSLGAFLMHNEAMKNNVNQVSRPFFMSLVLAWLAALSKETGLTILGICGAHEVAKIWLSSSSSHEKKKKKLSQSIARFAVLTATGVAYLLFRIVINGPSTGILPSPGDNPLITSESSLQYVLTAMYVMVIYIWRLIHPFTLLCDYGYNVVPLIDGLSDVRNAASITALVVIVVLTVFAMRNPWQRNDGRLLMGLTWMLVPLLPASHVLILGTVLAERLLFLPSLGYCMLVALVVEYAFPQTTKRRRTSTNSTFMTILMVVLALYTCRIVSRNHEWSTEEHLWEADYQSHPQNVKAAMSNAGTLYKTGNEDAAWHIVKDLQGLGDVQRFELCALQAKTTARSDEAGRDFEKAYGILDKCVKQVNARTNPTQKDQLVFSVYGYLLSQQEQYDEAAEWFRKASESAEQTNSNAVGPVCNEGEILGRLGQWEESVPILRKCADLSVRSREWNRDTKLMNLAKALYMTGNFDQAEQVLVHEMSQSDETLSFLETVRKVKISQQERAKAKTIEETHNATVGSSS